MITLYCACGHDESDHRETLDGGEIKHPCYASNYADGKVFCACEDFKENWR